MRIGCRRYQLLYGAHRPVAAYAVDRDLVAAIRRSKQPAPRGINIYIGHAVGQRCLAELFQPTGGAVYGKGYSAKRLRAQRHIEETLVAAHNHGHGRAAHRHGGYRPEDAGSAVQLEHRNVLAVRIGHINPCGGAGSRRNSHHPGTCQQGETLPDESCCLHGKSPGKVNLLGGHEHAGQPHGE